MINPPYSYFAPEIIAYVYKIEEVLKPLSHGNVACKNEHMKTEMAT